MTAHVPENWSILALGCEEIVDVVCFGDMLLFCSCFYHMNISSQVWSHLDCKVT